MTAVNVAYDEDDERKAIKKRLIALGLTLAAIVFIVVMLGSGRGRARPAARDLRGQPGLRFVLSAARWVLVAVAGHGSARRALPDRPGP